MLSAVSSLSGFWLIRNIDSGCIVRVDSIYVNLNSVEIMVVNVKLGVVIESVTALRKDPMSDVAQAGVAVSIPY